MRDSPKKEFRSLFKSNYFLTQVDGKRVHTNDHKSKRPFFPALDVDQPVEKSKKEHAPSPGYKHIRTRPDFFDNRKPGTPQIPKRDTDDSSGRQT